MRTGAVIVAAGMSSRMNAFKPLLRIGGDTVVRRIISTLKQAGAGLIVLITGNQAELLEKHVSDMDVVCLRNNEYATSQMFDSAKIGLSYLQNKCDRILFTPVDIPLFSEITVRSLLNTDSMIAVPVCDGKEGHPLLLDKKAVEKLLAYTGESGLAGAIESSGIPKRKVSVEDEGVLFDMDTPDDYEKLLKRGNMRHIYLLRHCRPEFPDGVERCISRTDYPLSKEGQRQARRLGDYFSQIPLTAVYCSTLARSVQTAGTIARAGTPVIEVEDLHELYCGQWEGLTFSEIKEKYPEQYILRGIDPAGFVPEQGECFSDGLNRFHSAVKRIISESSGDIAIVAHCTVNRLFLCSLLQKKLQELYTISQPYGCINEILQERDRLVVKRTGCLPGEFPDEETIRFLWERYHTPENIIAHCRAVANKAMLLAGKLAENGYELSENLIFASAMLHDIARIEPDHAASGAKRIAKEGYEKVADVIAGHHDLNEDENDPVTEKTIVYLADKLIIRDREATLEERFAESAAKCITAEAKAFHQKQYDQASAALLRVQRLIGKERFP